MLRTIRADFYRLKHTKSFWLTQFIFIAVIIFSVLLQATSSFGVVDMGEAFVETVSLSWTGTGAIYAMSTMSSLLIYIVLPLLVIIVGHDFAKGTYKNNVTVGGSRTIYFFSKHLTLLLIITLQLVAYYTLTFIVASLANGIGNDFSVKFVGELIQYIFIQLLFLLPVIALASLIIYLTGSNIAAILTGVVLPLAMSIFMLGLPHARFLQWLNFQGNLDRVMEFGLTNPELPHLILTAVATTVVISFITLFFFKKREL